MSGVFQSGRLIRRGLLTYGCTFIVMLGVIGGAVTIVTVSRPATAASPRDIKAAIDKAEDLVDEGRFDAAVPQLEQAVRSLTEALSADRAPSSLRLLGRRCSAIRQKLEQAGVDVSGISVPSPTTGSNRSAAMEAEGKAAPAGKAVDAGTISFTKEIAPVLVRSCGGCHVTGKKGDFHIPTFAALAQSGVVQPGAGQVSRIVEVIVSGDMPRGGGKVAANDLAKLVQWIDAGARYDGGDPTLPLATVGGRPQQAAQAAKDDVAPIATLKPGEVSFALDVAPVLIKSCLPCHGGLETESGFSLAAFARLLRGGGSGVAIEPGKASESLLVKKIRGTEIDGQRMPLGKAPLPNDVIARIAKWIDEGARLDVAAPGGDVLAIAAAGRAMHLSDEELTAVRREAAREEWRRFLPDETPETADGKGLTLIGNLPASRVATIASVAETVWEALTRKLVKNRSDRGGQNAGPVKGGVVLYAFAKSYDFSEFWLARYGTDRPRNATSSAGVAGDVVYAAVLVSDALLDEGDAQGNDLAFMIAKELGTAVFLTRGTPPWFAEGAGRVLAADVAPRATATRALRSDLPESIAKVGSCGDILAGRADPQAAATVAAAFLERLTASGERLPDLLAALDAGTDFDEAFQSTFRSAPATLLEGWMAQESRRNRRR